jgi:hypothetical protein
VAKQTSVLRVAFELVPQRRQGPAGKWTRRTGRARSRRSLRAGTAFGLRPRVRLVQIDPPAASKYQRDQKEKGSPTHPPSVAVRSPHATFPHACAGRGRWKSSSRVHPLLTRSVAGDYPTHAPRHQRLRARNGQRQHAVPDLRRGGSPRSRNVISRDSAAWSY